MVLSLCTSQWCPWIWSVDPIDENLLWILHLMKEGGEWQRRQRGNYTWKWEFGFLTKKEGKEKKKSVSNLQSWNLNCCFGSFLLFLPFFSFWWKAENVKHKVSPAQEADSWPKLSPWKFSGYPFFFHTGRGQIEGSHFM